MTADQFQREVIDALDLLNASDLEKLAMASDCLGKAADAEELNYEATLKWVAIGLAVYANGVGYSLETIFQMALDELEKEYGK